MLVLLGITACYAALAGSSLLIKTENWWTPHPTAAAAILTLGATPVFTAWVGAELARVLCRPRVLTTNVHPLKRLMTGLTIGLIGAAIGSLAVVMLEPAGGGFAWALTGGCAFISCLCVLAFARRARPGHCRRCEYDLSGVTVSAAGKCPECGLDQMETSVT